MKIHTKAVIKEETIPTAPSISFVFSFICPAIIVSVREMIGSIMPETRAGKASRLISFIDILFKIRQLDILQKSLQRYKYFFILKKILLNTWPHRSTIEET